MTKATNKEELNTIISVIGSHCMNFPIIPSHMIKGKNAARVVAVEAIIGQATSPTPCFAACILGIPSSISLYTFSTTTIPLSTNIPSAITREKRTIVFSVTPKKFRIINDKNIDRGMAIPTNSAFLNPRKKYKTVTTKMTPKIILFSKSATIVLVSLDWSLVLEMIRLSGKTEDFALPIISSILAEAFNKFWPLLFLTSSITTGCVYSRA